MILYGALLLGCLLYLLLQLNGVFNLQNFKFSIFVKTNIIPTAINLVVGVALIVIKEDIETFFPITAFTALMMGVSGQSLFKKLTNMFDSKVNTAFGVNND